MISEEEEKLNAKMDSLADEYMKREIPNADWQHTENLSLVFTYKKTANLVKLSESLVKHSVDLVKYSKDLSKLTIALYIMTAAMVILGIEQALMLLSR